LPSVVNSNGNTTHQFLLCISCVATAAFNQQVSVLQQLKQIHSTKSDLLQLCPCSSEGHLFTMSLHVYNGVSLYPFLWMMILCSICTCTHHCFV